MATKFTKEWLFAALDRAIRTFAQTALGFLAVGAAMSDIDWIRAFSVAGVATVISILTSVATQLPEATVDGTITNGEDGATATAQLEDKAKALQKKSVRLKVEK